MHWAIFIDTFSFDLGQEGGACAADITCNGEVETQDLALLAAWGVCGCCAEDIDGDGNVGITDFLELLANWGPPVSPP